MTFLGELKILIGHVFYWFCSFIFFSFFFFIFGIKRTVILGINIVLPLPSENSISVQVFNRIKHDLLPLGVQLITTNPLNAFVSQISISLMLSFLFTIPLLIYKAITYIHPALLPREKKVVLWSLLPFITLFFSGCLFSYLFIIPATFKVLYPFATVMGAIPFFSIDEFIQYVFGLTTAVGAMFLLPLFMILLSFLKIIKADFWMKKWRYALLFFLIVSAIITPDGTGITMAMLFFPLVLLYFGGCYFSNKFSKSV
jgi:sec-independent protein translocase protein TatC